VKFHTVFLILQRGSESKRSNVTKHAV